MSNCDFSFFVGKNEIIPKGMHTKILGNLATSELHGKKAGSDQKLSKLKMELQETLKCQGNSLKTQ